MAYFTAEIFFPSVSRDKIALILLYFTKLPFLLVSGGGESRCICLFLNPIDVFAFKSRMPIVLRNLIHLNPFFFL